MAGYRGKPTSENTSSRTSADRAAIERWEGEGGRARSPEDALCARRGDLPLSDPQDAISSAAPSRARSERERAGRPPS